MARSHSSFGLSVVGLLGVALVVLKLTGITTWPWVWVTLPFWGVFSFFAGIAFGFAVMSLLDTVLKRRKRSTR